MGAKRPAQNDRAGSSKKKRHNNGTDETYGQRAVFGGIGDITTVPVGDDELDCEDDSEALAYLKAVRQQAGGIPHVLVATRAGPQLPPKYRAGASALEETHDSEEEDEETEEPVDRSIYKNGTGDFRGYYHDGAYTAYPDDYGRSDAHEDEYDDGYGEEGEYCEEDEEKPQSDARRTAHEDDARSQSVSSDEGGPRNSSVDEIREAYFAALTRQYLALRHVLQREPPSSVIDALPSSNPAYVSDFGGSSSAFTQWTGRLRATDPLPAQVAGMHKDCVIRLLRVILGDTFLRKGHELRERTSRWIWALLARLPDRGELDYREIGHVRDLGKRAVLLMVSLAELQVLQENYDVGHNTPGSRGSRPENGGGEAEVDGDFNDEGFSQDGGDDDDDDDGSFHVEPAREPSAALKDTTQPQKPPPGSDEGEDSDVEMEMESEEEGEVSEEAPYQSKQRETADAPAADIEAMKARLLAQLDGGGDGDKNDYAADASKSHDEKQAPAPNGTSGVSKAYTHPASPARDDGEISEDEEEGGYDPGEPLEEGEAEAETEAHHVDEEELRRQVNLRATLNMILTVAGEFYGQRDLLEFRDPFSGLEA